MMVKCKINQTNSNNHISYIKPASEHDHMKYRLNAFILICNSAILNRWFAQKLFLNLVKNDLHKKHNDTTLK